MHSPALALNWQIWGRHRWGLAAALLIVAGICALPQAYPADKLTGVISGTDMPFMGAILMPLGFVMLYLTYVFSHAELGNRAGSSGFPLWMLTLPVRTRWLVLWPMVSAAVTVALIWLAVAWFALNKVGLDVPLVWPALGLACTLVWIQAIDWSPLGFIGKALIASGVLAGIWTGLMRDETRNAVYAALPALLLLGFVAGSAGVNRLRRGGRSSGPAFMLPSALRWRSSRPWRFATAQQAQFWLEWRRNGALLPIIAACWVVLAAVVGFFDRGDMTAMVMATPYLSLFLAPLAGLILGKPDVWSRQVRLPTFTAGRPLTCGDLVIAKLRMTALSLLAAWLILAVWVASTHYTHIEQLLGRLAPDHHSVTLYGMIAASLIGLFGFTLLLMAGTFVVSLTGRFWMILATLFIYLGGIPNLLAMDAFKIFKDYLVELAIVLLAIKLLLAGWAFRSCHRRKLISRTGIVGLIGTWLITVTCALLAFHLAFPAHADEMAYRNELRNFALAAGLFCPLFRIALAPMALAWNRHR